MKQEVTARPKWDIDRRLESLIGENVRVAAAAFAPGSRAGETNHLVKASELILSDGKEADAPVFFEGKLLSFRRQVAVVFVTLSPHPFHGEAANGRVLFRGTPAVIIHGPATVKLSHPFFIERMPKDLQTYWPHLLQIHPQLPLPLSDFSRLLSLPPTVSLPLGDASFPLKAFARGNEPSPIKGETEMKDEERTAKFSLGRIVTTPNALSTLNQEDVLKALSRHVTGDWGDCGPEDWKENEFSLDKNLRLFSVYHDRAGVKFWIITEADRSSTCILLPEDY